MLNVQLLIVDPQRDFCIADEKIRIPESMLGVGHGFGPVTGGFVEVPTGNRGSLVVPGADADMERLAGLIKDKGRKFSGIHITMDSHQYVSIERGGFWRRVSDGSPPAPFTILGLSGSRVVKLVPGPNDLVATDEEYTTFLPSFLHHGGPTGKGAVGYLQQLAANGRYPHVVWPDHCVVGEWGWSLHPAIAQAVKDWELGTYSGRKARTNYVTKGNNLWVEHFSGVKAEVQDPNDPTTQVNTSLIQALAEADIIAIAGEALSHCVANTGRDIAAEFSDPRYVEKMVLLTDATSNVTGFESLGSQFVKDLVAKGMKVSTTAEFLA